MPTNVRRSIGPWWTLPWLRRLERRELTWLFVGLGLCLMLFAFVSLAGEVIEGDTQAFDTKQQAGTEREGRDRERGGEAAVQQAA